MKHDDNQMMAGNLCATSPLGMAVVYGGSAAFIIEPQWSERPEDDAHVPPGTNAPDASYISRTFTHDGAEVTIQWGRSGGEGIIAEITTTAPVSLDLCMKPGWKNLPSIWREGGENGVNGLLADRTGGYRTVSVRTCPAPAAISASETEDATLTLTLEPGASVVLAAGVGELPDFSDIGPALKAAGEAYEDRRFKAEGDWGCFAQAISDSMNYSRTFSTFDNHRAHVVGRGWWIFKHNKNNPDFGPYFGWDQFFHGHLACFEDPEGARETVLAHLAYQLPEGFMANCSHWDLPQRESRAFVTSDRSQPPVGSMCVWKMHERWPDTEFLAEVYPKLVRWSEWWFEARDGNGNGLLEWGDGLGNYPAARLETGWDDTPHFDGVEMSGTQMAADAVDLNAIWSLDSSYLAKIAEALGKSDEAQKHRANHEAMNERINERLWNEELGIYCSRNWKDTEDGKPAFLTRITPMNFYPLACGAASPERAERVLEWVYNTDKFWGEWMLPTLPFDDPDWPKQHYWKGHIWPPPNFIVWQGLQQYADPEHLATFAERSVKLFMTGWDKGRICSENYRSDNGEPASHPNYTWGSLFPLIGVEALCDVDDDFNPRPREACGIKETVTLRNVPFGGTLYRVDAKGGQVSVAKEAGS
jgi:glycogen debranching enzyme